MADFFRNRLDLMIDLRHPLAVLANRMPWQEIHASLAQRPAKACGWPAPPTGDHFPTLFKKAGFTRLFAL